MILRILYLYDEIGNKEKAQNLLAGQLESASERSSSIIKIFTPTISSSSYPEPYKTNFSEKSYEDLKRFIDAKILYEASISAFGKIDYVPVEDEDHDPLTDENLIAKFQKMYLEGLEKVHPGT